jgi:hypothetical protein
MRCTKTKGSDDQNMLKRHGKVKRLKRHGQESEQRIYPHEQTGVFPPFSQTLKTKNQIPTPMPCSSQSRRIENHQEKRKKKQ